MTTQETLAVGEKGYKNGKFYSKCRWCNREYEDTEGYDDFCSLKCQNEYQQVYPVYQVEEEEHANENTPPWLYLLYTILVLLFVACTPIGMIFILAVISIFDLIVAIATSH